MAAVNAVRGIMLLLKVGDGNVSPGPELFTALCSINAERGISFAAEASEEYLPDCADPNLIAWAVREKTGMSATITGSGKLDRTNIAALYTWLTSPDAKNCQFVVDGSGGSTFAGKFHLTSFEITGNRGAKAECSISLASEGPVTRAAIA